MAMEHLRCSGLALGSLWPMARYGPWPVHKNCEGLVPIPDNNNNNDNNDDNNNNTHIAKNNHNINKQHATVTTPHTYNKQQTQSGSLSTEPLKEAFLRILERKAGLFVFLRNTSGLRGGDTNKI